MFGKQMGVEKADGTAFVATHSLAIEVFLQSVLDELQAGEISPDEAVAKIAAEAPTLHPVVEWIEKRGATLTLVATVLIALLTYVGQQGDPSLTPEDIRDIVTTIEKDLDDTPPPVSAPAPSSSANVTPPTK